MWGWQRDGAIRAEEGEWRVVVPDLEEGSWGLMDVMVEEAMVRSEAWVVLGRVTLEMCLVSLEMFEGVVGSWRRASSASRSMPWVARKDWAMVASCD
jgi:hypothetical protein